MTEEIWSEVVGYAGSYEVSTEGRVRNVRSGLILKPQVGKRGYATYGLPLEGGRKKRLSGHRMVAVAHIPNPSNEPLVRHLNGVKTDNRVANLAWGDDESNAADRAAHGNYSNGNITKTHCINGHEFSDANTYLRASQTGYLLRTCRACKRMRHRKKAAV